MASFTSPVEATEGEKVNQRTDNQLIPSSSQRNFDCLRVPNTTAPFSLPPLRILTFPRIRPLFTTMLQDRLVIARIAEVVIADSPERDRPIGASFSRGCTVCGVGRLKVKRD